MIAALLLVFACQLVGEILVRALSLPFPGPVIGMGILFALLLVRGRGAPEDAVPAGLAGVADGLLGNLSLLFVPAAVGIVQHFGLLRTYGGAILVALVGSTLLALVVTALVFDAVDRWLRPPADLAEPPA